MNQPRLRHWAAIYVAVQASHSAHATGAEPPRPPRACTANTRCQAILNRAAELSRAGQAESALRELREAYALSADPRVLASLGLAHQKLGKYAQALVDYRQAVASVPAGDALHSELRLPIAETEAALKAAQPVLPKPLPATAPAAVPGPVSATASATTPVQIHNNNNNNNQLTVQLGAPNATEGASSPRKSQPSSVHRWLWPVLGSAVAGAGLALGLAIALRPLSCAQADACIDATPSRSALTIFPSP